MKTKHQAGGLQSRLMTVFFLSGLLPLLLTGWVAALWMGDRVNDASRARSTAILEIKKNSLNQYLTQRREEMDMVTHSSHLFYNQTLQTLESLRDIFGKMVQHRFQEWFHATESFADNKPLAENLVSIDWVFRQAGGTPTVLNTEKGERWRTLSDVARPGLENFRERYGFENVYLISVHGNVVLTAIPESVLGENLTKGSFKESGLATLWNLALKKSTYQPFSPLAYLNDSPAAFMGAPLFAEKDGKAVGVLAVRLSPKNSMAMNPQVGALDKSIQFYLVGPDKKRYSATRDTAKNATVSTPAEEKGEEDFLLNDAMESATTTHELSATPAVLAALEGSKDSGLVKSVDGLALFSSWAPFSLVPGLQGADGGSWAVVAEQPAANAFSLEETQGIPFYKKQMELSGYYDFFLINTEGEVFHSATRQADFGTNMIHGKYAESNLGKLVQQVFNNPVFAMTDFSPYAPSHNEPAAFMAQPLIRNGKVIMVVALQLPLEAVTATMHHKDGLDDDGDAYLVGPDKRMRSDSILDPQNHSVLASFVGSVAENGVDSEAVRSALMGKTGVIPGHNFLGVPVFMAYTPLVWGNGMTWALLVETHFVETVLPFHRIPWSLLLAAIVGLLFCIGLAWLTARHLRRGIFHCSEQLQQLYQGKLLASGGSALPLGSRKDELAVLSLEIAGVADRWRHILSKLSHSSNQTALSGKNLMLMVANSLNRVPKEARQVDEIMDEGVTQRYIKQAESLEQSLMMAERCALQGASAIGQTLGTTQAIAEKAADFVEIARQTNLLSMKAVIEVANEGKTGKKFATVITDIRKLAERGRIIADEIGEVSLGNVRNVEKAQTLLTTFVPEVQKTVELARSMAVAEDHLRKKIIHFQTVTRQHQKSLHEDSMAFNQWAPIAQELSDQLALLLEELAFFKLGREGIEEGADNGKD